MSRPHFRRLGLRREVQILMPVAFLLVAVLLTFTLVSYRGSLQLQTEQRQQQVARQARAIAERLGAPDALPSDQDLRRLAPEAAGVALLEADGTALATQGDLPAGNLLVPLAGSAPDQPVAIGPSRVLPDRIAAFVPLGRVGARRYLRLDVAAPSIAGQRRSLEVLTGVVVVVTGALTLLVLLFLRHLLAPYETLLERARQIGDSGAESDDEIAFLVATFERAVVALARPPRGAEEDIAALERTLASSLESGVLLLDRAGGVLALNPVASSLLDLPTPLPGTPLGEALAPHSDLVSLLSRAVATGHGVKRHECSVAAGGRELTLGLTVHPLRRDSGEAGGYLVLFADLTEVRREAEESRLAESLSQLGELAAGVAHELRNSLATLRGYLTLIERRPEEDSIVDYLGEIRREADHLQRVLEDFLAFARPGTARLEEVDLATLVRRAAADPALAGANVEIADPAAPGAWMRGDAQLLERALRNLLHNAVEAQRASGGEPLPVEVRLHRAAEGLEVEIADRGPGLPEEVRARLFHPFSSGRPGGVGLGLALAHRIIVLHGGRIRLEDRQGGGTCAILLFPTDTTATERNSATSPEGAGPPAPAGAEPRAEAAPPQGGATGTGVA